MVDNQGNILKCSRANVSNLARSRFGYTASTNLIPILENIFGPLEEGEVYSSTDYSRDGEVITLQQASEGNGINIVFMGDAYTDRDMGNGGLYEELMRQSMEQFFSIEPYKTFRNRFNVFAVKVVSKHGKTGPDYSTALGTGASYSYISTGPVEVCYEYALKVPGITSDKNLLVGVLVNSASGRGIASMSENRQSSVAFYGSSGNDPDIFGCVLIHEAGGHGFAFLADEYCEASGTPSQEFMDTYNRLYGEYGWYSNIDFTNDPLKIRWSAFLFDKRYSGEIGIFEGAGSRRRSSVPVPASTGNPTLRRSFFLSGFSLLAAAALLCVPQAIQLAGVGKRAQGICFDVRY